MGFGHRVYKNYDPRAKLMAKVCKEVLESEGVTDCPELAIAQRLEQARFRRNSGAILAQFGAMILTPHPLAQIALEDEYFVKRKLYPNVDFYSGIVLRALGIPVNMFTVLFAVARSVGWLAQWNESFGDPSQRICRPRQLYHGTTPREFAPMEAR